jgi:hypothetical protein
LPEQYRAPFAEGIAQAARSTGEFGSGGAPAPFPGIPAEVAAQAQRLAQEAVHNGLTDAARVTLLLPAAALLLGVLAALTMRRPAPRTPPAEAPAVSATATTTAA